MHRRNNKRHMAGLLLMAFALLTGSFGASMAAADSRRESRLSIEQFMTGLACTESHGRFDAENRGSGAYGKYQIMPRNWPAWAARYMRDRWALPTPRNQEFVARARIQELYDLRQSWRRVAYWWKTGNGEADESLWSRGAVGYVNHVLAVALRSASSDASTVPEQCFPQPFDAPRIRTEPRERVFVKGGAVNVRRAPGYQNRSVSVVRRGEWLTVLSRGRDATGQMWLRVGLLNGRTGWVASWLTAKAP